MTFSLQTRGAAGFAALADITEEDYDRTFGSNVKGALFTVQKALPLLRDGASVILTGSTAASKGYPAFSVYASSKAAIRNFARGWIVDLGPRRIRVNILVPGRHIDARMERSQPNRGAAPGVRCYVRGIDAAGTHGKPGRDRGSSVVPRLR